MADLALENLAQYGACEISDSLIQMGYPHGGYIPDLNSYSPNRPTKIVGPAFTVKMVNAKDKDARKPEQHFVDASQEGSIMVISAPPECKNAVWGGLMTARAQARGVKGVVIDGRCRDLAEHREAGFSIYARGHSTLGQSPFTRPSVLQEPITIHARPDPIQGEEAFPPVTVHPGDFILADEDGVVVIPQKDIEEVVRRCHHNGEVDTKCMADLRNGRTVAATFKEHRGK